MQTNQIMLTQTHPNPTPSTKAAARFQVRPVYWVILLVLIALSAFYKFGRPIWKPLQVKAWGGMSVQDVLRRHKKSVSQRFPRWTQLINGKTITLVALKQERQLELWKWRDGRHTFIKRYAFTGYSGKLGPKLRQGDYQIPEGIYKISYLNPNSSYHLSMKVSYPNAFDRKMARRDRRTRLGGDIFIHGKDVTIGCIPIGDRPIEELFAIIASNGHRHTRVIIAPYDMRTKQKQLKIKGITWEKQLYTRIAAALKPYQHTTPTPRPRTRP